MMYLKNILVLFLLVLIFNVSAAPPRKIENPHLDNLYQVAPEIYRSEQPDEEGFRYLKTLGIKSVLNLREYHDDNDEAAGTGLVLYRYPLATGSVKEAQVVEILKIIKKTEKPLLIHCMHGSDRTGVICAAYRIVFEKWKTEDAVREFTDGPFGHHKLIYRNLPKLLRNMDFEKVRKSLADDAGVK